jgi:hypothetical protein
MKPTSRAKATEAMQRTAIAVRNLCIGYLWLGFGYDLVSMFHIQRVAGLAVRVKVSRREEVVSRGWLTLLTDWADLREQDLLPAGI